MLTIGLTGGIGSGKTSVTEQFIKLGTPVIDTDVIARELVDSNKSVQNEIIATFGNSIVSDDGSIDRKKLANVVFNEIAEKTKLEKILHPIIKLEVKAQLQTYTSHNTASQYVIIVVPLLFETDFRNMTDRILVITTDEKTRIERIMQRDNRDIDEIRSIIASQVTDDIRINEADDILVNNDKIEDLDAQVLELHKKYTEESKLPD